MGQYIEKKSVDLIMRAHVLELDATPEAHPIIPLTTLVGFRSYSHQQYHCLKMFEITFDYDGEYFA